MPFPLSDITATVGASNTSRTPPVNEAEARRVASEFEALLLSQLTASLNPAESEEGALFGAESGSGMYRQMFSEQIAKAMAQSGGIGLADLMLGQMRGKQSPGKTNAETGKAFAIARSIRNAPEENSKPATPVNRRTTSDAATSAVTDIAPSAVTDAATGALPPATTERASSPVVEVGRAIRPRRVFPVPPAARAASAEKVFATLVPVERVALQAPIEGVLRSKFGPRIDPINGKHGFHAGVDLAAPRGTPIGAAASGEVVFAGRNGGYGNMVILKHADGRLTRYGHADRLYVARGDFVNAGQTIAAVGSTGHSTGPHLHFEVFERGAPVNPLRALANAATLRRR